MPRTLQLITGTVNAGGAGYNTVTASPGSSFTVAAGVSEGAINLEQVWVKGVTTDQTRIFSPRMHDNNVGIQLQAGTTLLRRLLPWDVDQPLYPADTPTVQTHATGAGQSGIGVIYEYLDLPGAAPRLATWDDVNSRIEQVYAQQVAVTSAAAIGSYGANVALNAATDNFKANRDYALLGYTVNAACLAIAITGPDTSNYPIGGPGDPDPIATFEFFKRASVDTGRPFIPIIAANNRASTFVAAVDTAASTAVNVSLTLALLKQ
jgi:hypothetical protein